MIDDLDRSLERLLQSELPPDIVSLVSITFATPDASFPPPSVALPAIDLFLYDVRENRELRRPDWTVERGANGDATRRPPPVRVDCSYLVTAWARPTATTPVLDEHRLLSEAMRVLLRHATLPGPVLQGALRGQEPPLPAFTMQPARVEGLPYLWQALGGKPRAALAATVTIAVEPDEPEAAGPLVGEKRVGVDAPEGVG